MYGAIWLLDDNGLSMNEKLRQINEVILEIQRNSILPLRLLDGARMMEDYLPGRYFSNAIHVYRLKGLEWLNKVFQKHIDNLESELMGTEQFTFGPPPRFLFSPVRPEEDRLGERIDSRDSSASSSSRHSGSASLDKNKTELSGVFRRSS